MASKLSRNISANYVGAAWSSIIAIVFVPIHIRLLGPEAYGLIGFLMALRAAGFTFDLGLGAATSREVAYRANNNEEISSLSSLVRTVEVIYWSFGIFVGTVVIITSEWIGSGWLNLPEAGLKDSEIIFLIFGFLFIASWPTMLYRNVLRGFERHVVYNMVLVFVSTIRGVGSVLILIFISQTVLAFLAWQLIVALMEVTFLFTCVWRELRLKCSSGDVKFRLEEFLGIWQFSASTGIASALGVAISQIDKLVIGKLLSLEQLGYYSATVVLAAAMGRITTPIVTAVFPRLTAVYEKKRELRLTFLLSSKIISFIVAPLGLLLIMFPHDVLQIWLGTKSGADSASTTLIILSLAYMASSTTDMAVIIQIVGKTPELLNRIRLLVFIILLPLMWLLTSKYGITGAAASLLTAYLLLFFLLNFYARNYMEERTVAETITRMFAMLIYPSVCFLLFATAAILLGYFKLDLPNRIILVLLLIAIYYVVFGYKLFRKSKQFFV